MTSLQTWCETAWNVLESVPGDRAAELRQRWRSHTTHRLPVVTIFGPFDAGKSSLLKRLLVDSGIEVPDWLTVSARRETFEMKEVEAEGLIFRDTPGIAGGNEQHEAIAKEAVRMTDALLVALPPQLVTSDRETTLEVLSGKAFGCPAVTAFPVGALTIALSRMDEAGAMPREALASYMQLIERKKQELAAVLESAGVPPTLPEVLAVVADPFGLVGNSVPKGPSEYDEDRAWDGIDQLRAHLRRVSDALPALRRHAEVRFLSSELAFTRNLLEQLSSERIRARDAATNERQSFALVEQRLKTQLEAAEASLGACIDEELSGAARRGSIDQEGLTKMLIERLEAALERWTKNEDARLTTLVQEANVEFKARTSRQSWRWLNEVLQAERAPGDEKSAAAGRKQPSAQKRAQDALNLFHKAFREAQPLMMGMRLDEARKELKKLEAAGSFEKYAEVGKKGTPSFKTAAQAASARRAVLFDIGLGVVPALFELGMLASEVVGEQRASNERRQRREETNRAVQEASVKLTQRAWALWRNEGLPAQFEAALRDARASVETALDALQTEQQVFDVACLRVSDTLKQLQVAG